MNAEENRQLNIREIREGRTFLQSTPIWLGIELTGWCNIIPPCAFCAGKNHGVSFPVLDYSPVEKYGKFVTQASIVSDCSFGEALTHDALVPLARQITANGTTFIFPTNGLLLDRKTADALIACGDHLQINISVNAATPETYFKLTGRDFNRVIANIRYYVDAFRKRYGHDRHHLSLSMLVMKLNRGEVCDFLRLGHSLGAAVTLAPLFNLESPTRDDFGYRFVYQEERLPYETLLEIGRETKALAAELDLSLALQWDSQTPHAIGKLALPDVDIPCLFPWRWSLLQEHAQTVLACCFHTQPIADTTHQSLEEAWNCDRMQTMRRALLNGRIPGFCRRHDAACPVIAEFRHRGLFDRFDNTVDVDDEEFFDLNAGWYPVEDMQPRVRWTRGTAEIRMDTTNAAQLCVACVCYKPDIATAPITGCIEIDGRPGETFRLDDHRIRVVACPVPPGCAGEDTICRIVVDNPWQPDAFGNPADNRTLGIAVQRLWTE